MSLAAQLHEHVTCLGCGCSCDDIGVVVDGGRITETRNACALGAAWFGDGNVPAEIRSADRAVTLEQAIRDAAQLLGAARRPLVYLAPELSVEAQRAAVAIGDRLGAITDSLTSLQADAVLAGQCRGRATATFAEIRWHADLLVCWGVDPAARWPRYLSRVASTTLRETLFAVDVGADHGPDEAVARAAVSPALEVLALGVARATVRGRSLDIPEGLRPFVDLAQRMMRARYVVLVHASESPDATRDPDRFEALLALAQDLNGPTRGALSALGGGGNRAGAAQVMVWQTGFPMAVDFGPGYPVYRPAHAAAALLARREIDAALIAGNAGAVPPELRAGLHSVPVVLIGPRASTSGMAATVLVDTGVAGIHESGTAFRMDDVPLPLNPVLERDAPPPAQRVLAALLEQSPEVRRGVKLRIRGGTVYDPANVPDGMVRDICIDNGVIVADVDPGAPTLDARGMVVMPGGVDIHAHIAGASVNHGRRLLPEDRVSDPAPRPRGLADRGARSGTGGTLPSTFTTGYRYAGLGYTTVMEAAVAPIAARQAHAELDDTPIVDTGCFLLMGNNEYLLDRLSAGDAAMTRDFAAWLLGAGGGYAIKIVNPGGVAAWKAGGPQRNVTTIDDPVGSSRVTPRRILEALTDAAIALELPHPVHIHCNNLGQPGNVATTLDTMRALDGRRAHYTHLQFHSYGGAPGSGWQSAARQISEYVNGHPEVSVDVGQVMFGPATTVTADAPVEYLLHASTGRKWTNVDLELETGCGIVPYAYRERAAVAALQWAVGLELFLLAQDPWRVVLSTDHPNGASFRSYPELIRLLMDRAYRDDQVKRVNQKLLGGSALLDGLAREYTLSEIAIVTRAAPARLLGLERKGHLGIGADADVTIYATDPDRAKMFATPRYVVKGGVLVVSEGELVAAPAGRRLHVRPEFDPAVLPGLKRHFAQSATIAFENYPVRGLPPPIRS